jgi:hypothetical protein
MSSDVTAEAPQRGRPRSERARKAILEAAAELLLARGLSAVSMDAPRTPGHKATIYLWPTKETLAPRALHRGRGPPQARDTARCARLHCPVPPVARLLQPSKGCVIAVRITESQTDPCSPPSTASGSWSPAGAGWVIFRRPHG